MTHPHLSIPEYVESLDDIEQLRRLRELSDQRIKAMEDQGRVAIWRVYRDVDYCQGNYSDWVLAHRRLLELAQAATPEKPLDLAIIQERVLACEIHRGVMGYP